MSEAKIDKLNMPPEDSADSTTKEFTGVDFLNTMGWSPIVPPRYRPTLPEVQVITEIDKLPIDERIVASAYYALQLGGGSLKSVGAAASELGEIDSPPGESRSQEDQQIVNNFLVATTVEDLLWSAYNRYRADVHVQEISAKQETAGYTPENTGCLAALKRMRTAHQANRRIPESIARSSEIILRMLITDWTKNESDVKSQEYTVE